MAARRRVVEAPRTKRNAPQVESIRVVVLPDEEAEDVDEAVGVIAEAEVIIEGVIQTLTSGGLWGIEGDASEYIAEVAEEEYADLRKILISIGVPTSQLPQKMERGWIVRRA